MRVKVDHPLPAKESSATPPSAPAVQGLKFRGIITIPLNQSIMCAAMPMPLKGCFRVLCYWGRATSPSHVREIRQPNRELHDVLNPTMSRDGLEGV